MIRLSRPLSCIRLVLREARRSWIFPVSLMVADLLLAALAIEAAAAFWLDRTPEWPALAAMAMLVVAGQAAALSYAAERGGRAAFARIVAGNVLAVAGYWAVHGLIGHGVSRGTFAQMALLLTPLQFLFHCAARRGGAGGKPAGLEPLRWVLLAGGVGLLYRPLFFDGVIGAGDAYWYGAMVADFVSQWRAGIFPVFAGQSGFAFNGAISPLRLAPALQHLAGLIDLLTFHSLPFFGLLNLALIASFAGGAFVCYRCLRLIEPLAPWLALVLSLLYIACPGVLSLVYVGDLLMSVTALPFIPLLLYGAWRTYTHGDTRSVLIMVAGAAALWYCHPPIAFWGTLIAAVTQGLRLFRDGAKPAAWRGWAVGLVCFGLLSLYCFVSVQTAGAVTYPAFRTVLLDNLRSAFPAALLPVGESLGTLGSYQLGWALWIALLAGAIGAGFSRRRWPAAGLLAGAVLLLAFLIPTPWLLEKLWMHVPQAFCDITFMWPMQRFYALLAALAVFLFFGVFAPLVAHRPRAGALCVAAALGGLAWSASESVPFIERARLTTTPAVQAARTLLPENRVLTRYSFGTFHDIPSYYSHGFIDPELENRLLAPGTFRPNLSNAAALEQPDFGTVVAEGELRTEQPDPVTPTLVISPGLRLQPQRRYVLHFDFAHPDFAGAFKLIGSRLMRTYYLPNSGYDTKTVTPQRAFGSLPGLSHSITIWTDGESDDEVSLEFFFTGDGPRGVTTFGRYQLKEFDPDRLPIQVDAWTPYRARVAPATAAYLETPRLFFAGYRATVNGRPAAVERSPDARVMIPVPAGDDRVELAYVGTPLLRAAYWLSLLAWLAALAAAASGVDRRAGPAAADAGAGGDPLTHRGSLPIPRRGHVSRNRQRARRILGKPCCSR